MTLCKNSVGETLALFEKVAPKPIPFGALEKAQSLERVLGIPSLEQVELSRMDNRLLGR